MSKVATLRLDRLLANLGYGSRRETQSMARAGVIELDGAVLDDSSERIALTPDLPERLRIDGENLDPLPGFVIVMHKPLDIVCSHKEGGRLVYDLLPPRWRQRDPALSTIGRLDKDTSGLLLLTDDGALLHKIISPRNHVTKRYHATLSRELKGDEAALFAAGTLMLEGEDKPLAPAQLEPLSPTTAFLTVTEGRYHQVRRMFAATGNRVTALHRDRMGGLALPADLAAGAWRTLSPAEIALVLSPESAAAEIRTRPYRSEDLDTLSALFKSSMRRIAGRDYTSAQMTGPTWVAEIAGTIVGVAGLEPDGRIDLMYVDANHEGRGVASALLHAIEAAAREKRVARLFAEASLTARPFFERRGFRESAPQTGAVNGEAIVNCRMEKVITPD